MNICILGTGQLGTQLATELSGRQLSIAGLYNKSPGTVNSLAEQLDCFGTNRIDDLPREADLYLICVRDDAIIEVAEALSEHISPDRSVAHTSGVLSSTVLEPFFDRYGSWYPLNSVSHGFEVNWMETPIFISANETGMEEQLKTLGRSLSAVILDLNEDQRIPLHISAVIVNNFTNHLLQLSKSIADAHELEFKHLLPLLKTTIEKALANDPRSVQTGPARRGDHKTIDTHIQYLEKHHPEAVELYRKLSRSILGSYEKNNT